MAIGLDPRAQALRTEFLDRSAGCTIGKNCRGHAVLCNGVAGDPVGIA